MRCVADLMATESLGNGQPSQPFVERVIGNIRREYLTTRSCGIRSTFTGSAKRSASITAALASTAPSTAPHPRIAPGVLHHRRQAWITICGMTTHPDDSWMLQMSRNLLDSESGFLRDKKDLIVDRDTKYSAEF